MLSWPPAWSEAPASTLLAAVSSRTGLPLSATSGSGYSARPGPASPQPPLGGVPHFSPQLLHFLKAKSRSPSPHHPLHKRGSARPAPLSPAGPQQGHDVPHCRSGRPPPGLELGLTGRRLPPSWTPQDVLAARKCLWRAAAAGCQAQPAHLLLRGEGQRATNGPGEGRPHQRLSALAERAARPGQGAAHRLLLLSAPIGTEIGRAHV